MSTAAGKPIDIMEATRKMKVDNLISLRYYYRIADNLLQEANIYREMKNLVDLYIVLLRFSSLISETIPCHKDYTISNKPEKDYYKKKLLLAMKELDTLRPEVERKIAQLNKSYDTSKQETLAGGSVISLNNPRTNNDATRQNTYPLRSSHTNMKVERWVGSGLGLVDPFTLKTDKFSHRADDKGSSHNNVKGESWVGSGSGLVDPFTPKTHKFSSRADNKETCHNTTKRENWVGLCSGWVGSGLGLVDPFTLKTDKFSHRADDKGSSHNNVKGESWVGSGSGLVDPFTPKTHKFSSRADNKETCHNTMKRENWVGLCSVDPFTPKSSCGGNNNSSCVVCFDGEIEGACVPCGHMAGCMACLNGIKANNLGCPICRAPIQLVLRLYAV